MKKKLPSVLTLLMLLASGSAAPTADSGFEPLFNGKDWNGWHLKIKSGDNALAQRLFIIEDGMVHAFGGLPDKYELDTGKNRTHGMIYTDRSYQRFIFRFEYKWGTKIANNFTQFQYDAGCYYHVSNDRIWPVGFEYQIRYNHLEKRNHTGDFWSPPGTKLQWYSADGSTFMLPAKGGLPQPIKKGEHRALATAPYHALGGQWNQCEVIVMGNKYAIHKLNGVIVNLATDLSHGEGLIGLQAETAEVYYRNIEIKELTGDIPMEMFLK
jgi:hypothetical protein